MYTLENWKMVRLTVIKTSYVFVLLFAIATVLHLSTTIGSIDDREKPPNTYNRQLHVSPKSGVDTIYTRTYNGLVNQGYDPNSKKFSIKLKNKVDRRLRKRGLSISFDTQVSDHNNVSIIGQCSQESISKLTALMREAEYDNVLQSLSIDRTIRFSGIQDLLTNVFATKRIVTIGDSTLLKFSNRLQFLLQMMKDTPSHPILSSLETLPLKVLDKEIKAAGDVNRFRVTDENNDMNILSFGNEFYRKMFDANDTLSITGLDNVQEEFQSIVTFHPEVMVINLGLHLFHLTGFFTAQSTRNPLPLWLEYEKFLLSIVELAENARAKTLLFKTTNLVCEDLFVDEWKTDVDSYDRHDERTLANCFSKQRTRNPDTSISDDDILNYCKDGWMSEHASDALNQRLYTFVNDIQAKKKLTSPQLSIEVFNDHDLQFCGASRTPSDGRHYPVLNLNRIRLMGNLLECLDDKPLIETVEEQAGG